MEQGGTTCQVLHELIDIDADLARALRHQLTPEPDTAPEGKTAPEQGSTSD